MADTVINFLIRTSGHELCNATAKHHRWAGRPPAVSSGMPPRKKAVRRKKAAPASVGLTAAETKQVQGGALDTLRSDVERDGGSVLGAYSDPFGGKPLLVVALPVERVEPTPYQRDASDAH